MAHWWVRYPLAGLLVWGAAALYAEKPQAWWASLAFVIWAMVLAKEISLLVLLVGAAILLFQGVAALPVSVAVIIGAIIIASALRR